MGKLLGLASFQCPTGLNIGMKNSSITNFAIINIKVDDSQ
jgi:hypothetical protein